MERNVIPLGSAAEGNGQQSRQRQRRGIAQEALDLHRRLVDGHDQQVLPVGYPYRRRGPAPPSGNPRCTVNLQVRI
jgi:hypothetical protein